MSLSLSASHSYWELPATHGVYRRMRAKISLLVMLVCLASAPFYAAKGKQAAETKPEHEQIIREGIALHDEGKYKEAIARYDRVLAENPDDVFVMYEKAYAQSASGQHKECNKLAKEALQYEGINERVRHQLFVARGSCQDELGSWKDAIKTYREGLEDYPQSPSLYFNIGVTYYRQKQWKDARANFQQALLRDPLHASSHLMLGNTYGEAQYRIPAILALSRFLILEPASPRSSQAAQNLINVLNWGISSEGGGKVNINVLSPLAGPKDEGDFTSQETMLSIVLAGAFMTEKNKDQSPHEKLQSPFLVLFDSFDEAKIGSGFAASFYVPYFKEMATKKFCNTFVRFSIRNVKGADDRDWLAKNQQNVRDFLAWSEAYKWK